MECGYFPHRPVFCLLGHFASASPPPFLLSIFSFITMEPCGSLKILTFLYSGFKDSIDGSTVDHPWCPELSRSPHPFKLSLLLQIIFKSFHTFISSQINTASKGMFNTGVTMSFLSCIYISLQWFPIGLGLSALQEPFLPTSQPYLDHSLHLYSGLLSYLQWPLAFLTINPHMLYLLNVQSSKQHFHLLNPVEGGFDCSHRLH